MKLRPLGSWPDGEDLTVFAEQIFGVKRTSGESDDGLKARMRAKVDELRPPDTRPN